MIRFRQILFLMLLTNCIHLFSQPDFDIQKTVPASLHNIMVNDSGKYFYTHPSGSAKISETDNVPEFSIDNFRDCAIGTANGIEFKFGIKSGKEDFNGMLKYGFFANDSSRIQLPAYIGEPEKIIKGKCSINLSKLLGMLDKYAGYKSTGKAKLGYKVFDEKAGKIYEGRLSVSGRGPFTIICSIIEGPFVGQITTNSAVFTFKTDKKVKAKILSGGKEFPELIADYNHEIKIDGLTPSTHYNYKIIADADNFEGAFTTAPLPGSRTDFSFAFICSNSEQYNSEGFFNGINNSYLTKAIATAYGEGAKFIQFTGNYGLNEITEKGSIELQYANWKRSVEPWAGLIPMYTTRNANGLFNKFNQKNSIFLDKFPYEKMSGEKLFAENFANFQNGPASEDESKYDPDKIMTDFPDYSETAYFYVYDNIAVVCLNSDYWTTYPVSSIETAGGNPAGYIMDSQLQWLKETLTQLDKSSAINNIFIVVNSPVFPNDSHNENGMWYGGNNKVRPFIAGKGVDKGIVERRDELLNTCINQSNKVMAILTGGECSYTRTEIDPQTPIYNTIPENPLKIGRNFTQISLGSETPSISDYVLFPWSNSVKRRILTNVICIFHVHGSSITMDTINPLTMETIESIRWR